MLCVRTRVGSCLREITSAGNKLLQLEALTAYSLSQFCMGKHLVGTFLGVVQICETRMLIR